MNLSSKSREILLRHRNIKRDAQRQDTTPSAQTSDQFQWGEVSHEQQ